MAGCLTKSSIVILLLCSQIGLDIESNATKPFTARQWAELSEKMTCSPMKCPETFLYTTEEDWIRNLGIQLDEAHRMKALLSRTARLYEEIGKLERMGISLTTPEEKNYPEKLKARLGKESPPVLYYSGSLDILQNTTIAVFGSANWDKICMKFARVLADKCVKQDLLLLTGGGIAMDYVIEAGVLKQGGKAAYLLSYDYLHKLRQKEVQGAISSGNLLLISAVHPNAPLTLRSSMEKSKYIYGLADYAVVVSVENRSGIIYNESLENLRKYKIPLFVREDGNMPDGNAALIEQGVQPLGMDGISVFVDGIVSGVL